MQIYIKNNDRQMERNLHLLSIWRKILKYLVKWVFLFLGVSILSFLVVRLLPVSPVEMLLQKYNLPLTEENKAFLTLHYGLDKSIVEQYYLWLVGILKGDFGISFFSRLPVREEFFRRLPYSFMIGFFSLLLANIFSFILGYFAAIEKTGILDRITRFFSILTLSFPSFLIALFIIYFLGVKVKIISFFSGNSFGGSVFSIFILCFYQMGNLTRIVCNRFLSLQKESYVKFYVIRGFSLEYVLFRHCYKPVLYSLLSASVSKCSSVIGGSSVLEFVFSIPGISYFLISSIVARDYNVIQAYIFFVFVWMFLIHLLFDIILFFFKERKEE